MNRKNEIMLSYIVHCSISSCENLLSNLISKKITKPFSVKKQFIHNLLEIKVKKGNRKDLGRPTTTPIQNKEALMDFLKK